MKTYKNQLNSLVSKVDRRHVRIALLILSLSMFLLGAGAPGSAGDMDRVIIPFLGW